MMSRIQRGNDKIGGKRLVDKKTNSGGKRLVDKKTNSGGKRLVDKKTNSSRIIKIVTSSHWKTRF